MTLIERVIALWRRWQACKMAATLCAGWKPSTDGGITPMLWSATVFFESYLTEGAEGTREDFGPKDPAQLKPVGEA